MSGSHSHEPSTFGWLKMAIVLSIWTVVALLSIPLIIFVAPDIETRILPVLRRQTISDVHFSSNKGDFLLFRWDYDKVRYGRPEWFAWTAYDIRNPRDRYSIDVYSDWQCKTNMRTVKGAPQGERVHKLMCARLPEALYGNEWLMIEGVIEYSLRHPFYTLTQIVPDSPDDWPVMAQTKKAPEP